MEERGEERGEERTREAQAGSEMDEVQRKGNDIKDLISYFADGCCVDGVEPPCSSTERSSEVTERTRLDTEGRAECAGRHRVRTYRACLLLIAALFLALPLHDQLMKSDKLLNTNTRRAKNLFFCLRGVSVQILC